MFHHKKGSTLLVDDEKNEFLGMSGGMMKVVPIDTFNEKEVSQDQLDMKFKIIDSAMLKLPVGHRLNCHISPEEMLKMMSIDDQVIKTSEEIKDIHRVIKYKYVIDNGSTLFFHVIKIGEKSYTRQFIIKSIFDEDEVFIFDLPKDKNLYYKNLIMPGFEMNIQEIMRNELSLIELHTIDPDPQGPLNILGAIMWIGKKENKTHFSYISMYPILNLDYAEIFLTSDLSIDLIQKFKTKMIVEMVKQHLKYGYMKNPYHH